MGWFHYYGLIVVVIIMIPIIVILAQIGRYGCMAFMIFNIPYTYFDFWFDPALVVYLSVNGVLLALYLLGWILYRKGRGRAKMLWLSITPTVIFLFSGITVLSIPLVLCSVIFGIGHITIGCKNIE